MYKLEESAPPEGARTAATGYRPDIDGLRAIAVLLVMLYHAGVPGLGGGFVGVDVFFVLTGFLITGLVVRAMDGGTFRFGQFYLRRLRRLMPAALLMLVVTSVAAWFLLLPEAFVAYADSLRFALLSASNVHFWLHTGGYFDGAAEEMPLLHTWSLGVEEQFYFLWPAGLWLLHRLAPARRLWAVALLAALAFGFSEWASRGASTFAYFMLPARAFEILLGAILALLPAPALRVAAQDGRLRTVAAGAGLALVVGSAVLLDERAPFPGWRALIPCIGTTLLLVTGPAAYWGGAHGTLWHRLLATSPFVRLGLWSYSIYLWHWPIVAFLHAVGLPVEGWIRVLAIGLPVASAAVAYVLVERPFRERILVGLGPTVAAMVGVPALLGWSAHSWVHDSDGLPSRFEGLAAQGALETPTAASSPGCQYDRDLKKLALCTLGVRGPSIDGVLVGDSYAGMITPLVDVLATDAGLSLRHRWFSTSPPMPDVSVGRRRDEEEAAYSTERQRLLRGQPLVVLGSVWGNYSYEPESKVQLWNAEGRMVSDEADALQVAAIEALLEAGSTVVIVDRPRGQPGARMMKRVLRAQARGKDLTLLRVPARPRGQTGLLARLPSDHPGLVIFHADDPVCGSKDCAVAIDGVPLYRPDGSHYSKEGAQRLGLLWLRKGQNPLRGLAKQRQ